MSKTNKQENPINPNRQLRSTLKSDVVSQTHESPDTTKQSLSNLTEGALASSSVNMAGVNTGAKEDLIEVLGKLSKKIDNLATDLTAVKNNMQLIMKTREELEEVKTTANTAHDIAEECKNDVAQMTAHIRTLEKQLNEVKLESKSAKAKAEKLQEEHSKLDTYVRRDNLIFKNIPVSKEENTELVLRKFLKELKIDNADTMQFVRVHRMKGNDKHPGPIICRFECFGDRMKVWGQKTELKESKIQIQEDFHPDIVEKRRTLYPIMKEARKNNMLSVLSQDKLIIDGKAYTVHTLDKLPVNLKSTAMGVKESPNSIAFFTNRCPLSNFFKTSFMDPVDNITYHSTEQYLQYKCAQYAGDEVSAAKILQANTPLECKSLSKSIKNLKRDSWEADACSIMKRGLRMKFESDAKCKEFLMATGNKSIGEATADDKFWGTGVSLRDTQATNTGVWTGNNYMGRLLEEIRDELN